MDAGRYTTRGREVMPVTSSDGPGPAVGLEQVKTSGARDAATITTDSEITLNPPVAAPGVGRPSRSDSPPCISSSTPLWSSHRWAFSVCPSTCTPGSGSFR